MKIHAILAALVLAAPATAFADRRVIVVNRSYSGSHYHPPSCHTHGSSYVRYRSSSYGPRFSWLASPPRYYGGVPSLRLSYSSSGPRYYSAGNGDDDAGSIEVDVQRELRRRGYYRGPLDGDIGPGSRAAIRAYQADRGLGVSGRIDSTLLRSLGL